MFEKLGKSSASQRSEKPWFPFETLAPREYVAVFLALAVLFFVSSFTLPLGTPPSAAPLQRAGAPWIFGGIQWLLVRLPVAVAGILVPALSLLFLLTLPWWGRRVGARLTRWVFLAFALVWLGLTLLYQGAP